MKVIKLTWQETMPIRHQVLWPDKPERHCHVDGDEEAYHFGVVESEQLICVASIYINNSSARLRKFATLPEYQKLGAGSLMIEYVLSFLEDLDLSNFWFDARESAIDFYQRFGFEVQGERFYKSDVPYFKMIKA